MVLGSLHSCTGSWCCLRLGVAHGRFPWGFESGGNPRLGHVPSLGWEEARRQGASGREAEMVSFWLLAFSL